MQAKALKRMKSRCSASHSTKCPDSPNSCTLQSFSALLEVDFGGDSKDWTEERMPRRAKRERNHPRKIDQSKEQIQVDKLQLSKLS